VVLAERPNKRYRRCDASQAEVQELRVEVKYLRDRCETLQSRSQSHLERAKCHRERSQDDMKAIQGTIGGTKDAMTGLITDVKIVLKGVGVGKAVHGKDRPGHTDERNADSTQPLSCVFSSSVRLLSIWTVLFTVMIVLLLLASGGKKSEIKNRALSARNLPCKIATCASGPMSSKTVWSITCSRFLDLTSA
jgi:hypothetical protein